MQEDGGKSARVNKKVMLRNLTSFEFFLFILSLLKLDNFFISLEHFCLQGLTIVS